MTQVVIRRHRLDIGIEIRLLIQNSQHLGALRAFHQNLDSAIRQFEHLQNICDAADAIHVVSGRFILGGRFLRHQHDALARFHRRLKRLDRLRAPDKQRNHHVGKYHHIAQRKQRKQAGGNRCINVVFSHGMDSSVS